VWLILVYSIYEHIIVHVGTLLDYTCSMILSKHMTLYTKLGHGPFDMNGVREAPLLSTLLS
jgi:hypothetical protein